MSFLELTGIQKRFGGCRCGRRLQPGGRTGRVRLVPGPIRMWQDHDAADDRGVRAAHGRHDRHRRRRRDAPAAKPAQRGHGLPVVRAVPEHERCGQHRVRTQGAQTTQGADHQTRWGAARPDPPRRARRSIPVPAVRRPAAARRVGPRPRHRATGAPPRRAALSPRCEDPDHPAQGDPGDPAPARDHDGLRHARPGGGAVALGSGRRHERGPDRADRDAVRDLQLPGHRVRRVVRRHAQPCRRRRGRREHRPTVDRRPGSADGKGSDRRWIGWRG